MPVEVGSALATLQQGNSDLATLLAQEMEEAIAFSGQLEDIEADFSAAELEEMKMQGALRGVKRFKDFSFVFLRNTKYFARRSPL